METRLEMYQKAIEDLEQVQLKSIEMEVKRMKIAATGLCVIIFVAMAFALVF